MPAALGGCWDATKARASPAEAGPAAGNMSGSTSFDLVMWLEPERHPHTLHAWSHSRSPLLIAPPPDPPHRRRQVAVLPAPGRAVHRDHHSELCSPWSPSFRTRCTTWACWASPPSAWAGPWAGRNARGVRRPMTAGPRGLQGPVHHTREAGGLRAAAGHPGPAAPAGLPGPRRHRRGPLRPDNGGGARRGSHDC